MRSITTSVAAAVLAVIVGTSGVPAASAGVPDVPTSCASVGSAAHRAQVLAGLTGSPGPATYTNGPKGATTILSCSWFGGDVTGATVRVAKASVLASRSAVRSLLASGYTCISLSVGRQCQKIWHRSYFGNPFIQVRRTLYTKDLWLDVTWSNLDFTPIWSDLATAVKK